jgi:hypothetical protein
MDCTPFQVAEVAVNWRFSFPLLRACLFAIEYVCLHEFCMLHGSAHLKDTLTVLLIRL